jgi:hypothetical protein
VKGRNCPAARQRRRQVSFFLSESARRLGDRTAVACREKRPASRVPEPHPLLLGAFGVGLLAAARRAGLGDFGKK